MILRTIALASALAMALGLGAPGGARAAAPCPYKNETPLRSISAGFEAWKAVTAAMAECGNFEAELDQEFATKQPAAFAANPALYQIGGVANETLVPLLNGGTIRPLDGLVAQMGQQLGANQLIKVDGKVMAVAMMVNAQHLMYRADILEQLKIAPPTTYDEVLAAAARIKQAGTVPYPLGATMKTGWNLGQEFVNMYLGYGGAFFGEGNRPAVNGPAGVKALETMKALTAYMDPEFLVSDSTYVQQQFQQGKIAMANLWASRAGAMEAAGESSVRGKVAMAVAPRAVPGGKPATTLWWDGAVIARNISDAQAEAAFRLLMVGFGPTMVAANNDAAVWLVKGFKPGPLAQGAIDTLRAGAPPYPASTEMGLMHTALGNNVADFLTGKGTAEQTLAKVEAAYLAAAREAGVVK